jgi:hypothetical protein
MNYKLCIMNYELNTNYQQKLKISLYKNNCVEKNVISHSFSFH